MNCQRTWFVDGGRTEANCRQDAAHVCFKCGNARCESHDDLGFDEVNGQTICEECQPEQSGSINNYTLHTPDLRTYKISGDTPHAALKQFCDDILTDTPAEKSLMPNGAGEWLVYMYVAPQWKGTHRITVIKPDRFTTCAGWDFERIDTKKNLLRMCGLSEDFATSGWGDLPADVQQKILYAPIQDGQQ